MTESTEIAKGANHGRKHSQVAVAGREERRSYAQGEYGKTFPRSEARSTVPKGLAWIRTHPGTSLIVFLLAIAGVRLGLAITYAGYLGVDTGAYLLGVNEVWGGEPTGTSFSRPPLAPGFLMVPFLEVFGGYLGANIYAAVFSMSIFPSFYLLAQRLLGKGWGAIATAALAFDLPLAEMFVTGVVPITGFAALALVLWGLLKTAYNPSITGYLAVIVGLPLIAFTNQTTLGLAFVTVPLAWLILPEKRRLFYALGLGTLVALSAFPWYVDVLPGADRVSYPGALVYLNPWWSSQWIQALGGVIVAATVCRFTVSREPRPVVAGTVWHLIVNHELRVVAGLLLAHSVLNVLLSHDEALMNVFYRSSYWMAIPFWICTAYLVRALLQRWRPTWGFRAVAVALFLGVGAYGVQDQFYGQAFYSNLAGPDVLAALESIPPEQITRIGTNAESRAFYFAALTKKPVAWVQSAFPAEAYVEQERQARCSLGWRDDCDGHAYVSHWIIDTRHTQQIDIIMPKAPNPTAPWAQMNSNAPWLEKTFERGTVQVWTARDL